MHSADKKRKADDAFLAESAENTHATVFASDPSGEDRAMHELMAAMKEPCQAAKYSVGGGKMASIEGVLLRTSKINVKVNGVMMPKLKAFIAVSKIITNGCKDVICTGVDGMTFMLPTHTTDASPEEVAKDSNAKGPVAVDVFDSFPKAVYLGIFAASVPLDGPGKPGQAVLNTPGIEQCVPGMKVLVTGCNATFNKSGTMTFSNAKKITPLLSEPVAPGSVAANIIAESRIPSVQRTAALLYSMHMGGFFENEYPEVAHQQQADCAKAMWQQVVEGAASRCESLALSLRSDTDSQETVAALQSSAQRIRSLSAQDVASGAPLFNVYVNENCVTPYQAPIVQFGVTATKPVPEFCRNLIKSDTRNQVPSSFVDAKVKEVTFKGLLIQLAFQLWFCFDKTSAALAIQDGKCPILRHTDITSVSCKFSKRRIGPELFGVLADAKIEMVAKEVLPFANMALWTNISPRSTYDTQLESHWTDTNGIDLIDGVCKVGVQISEKWLDTNMLSGRGVHIWTPVEDLQYIEAVVTAGPSPTLIKNCIQALTECAFEFDSLKTPSDKTKKFFIVYDECSKDIEANPSVVQDVEKGEFHMDNLISAQDNQKSAKDFIKEKCVVYAVAV
jgi:hypothetical protein